MLGWLDGIFGDLDTNAPLLEPDDPALVAYLHAMPGSGKTYLIDRWLFLRQERAKEAGQTDMPSLVVDLPLDRKREYSAEDLRNELVAKLRLGGTNPEAELRAALQHRFLRIENVDSPEFGHAVAELASSLIGCRLIVSGRWFAEGSVPKRWRQQAVELLTPEQAAQQFAQEVGEEFWNGLTEDQREALTIRTARLPLAIHLAAGFLMKGTSVEKLLDRLPQLTLQDADDPRFGQSVLKIMFDELWKSLDQTLRSQPWLNADELLAGFRRLGFAHPAGIGRSLAAATSGLSEEDLDDLLVEAATLHLVELEPDSDRFRLHPLIAEQLTASVEQSPVDAAVTDWFCERLPEPEDQTVHNTAWHEIHAEHDALVSWLESLPDEREVLVRVEQAGSWFAMLNGPFGPWVRLCERGLLAGDASTDRSNFLWTLGQCADRNGDGDRALAASSEKAKLEKDRGEDRLQALALGLQADVLQARGELDEALRIRREEQLPVYERLGATRDLLVGRAKLALNLLARNAPGDREEAAELLRQARAAAEKMGIPEAGQIREIQEREGLEF